ncbi:MAG TPA: hypothetical protein VFS20_32130 [Longimicrobium sp.]|nr:hypothetical protein [Longimicrobium sp.]
MRLLRLDEADKRGMTVFREPPGQPVALVGGMTLIALAIVVTGMRSDDGFFTFLGVGLLLMAVWLATVVRKVFLPSNWVLAIGNDRVLVHFRPYVNTSFPASDPQVLEIGWDEIASVQPITMPVTQYARSHVVTRSERFLVFRLSSADLAGLRERLRYERSYRGGGPLTLSQHPVTVTGSDGVRVSWRGTSSWLRPRVDEALRLLAPQVPVEAAETLAVDLTRTGAASGRARDFFVDSLVQQGEGALAVATASKLYGVGMDEARRIVARFDAAAAGEPADGGATAPAPPGAR